MDGSFVQCRLKSDGGWEAFFFSMTLTHRPGGILMNLIMSVVLQEMKNHSPDEICQPELF